MKSSVIAVIATIFGCLLTALGYILIKKSHAAGARKGRHNFFTIEFVAAFFICGTSTAISIVSLAFADIITLSSLSGLTIVFNTVFAITLLKEAYTKIDIICVILITLGASICVVFSNYSEVVYSTDDMLGLIFSAQSIIFLGILIAGMIIGTLYQKKIIDEIASQSSFVQSIVDNQVTSPLVEEEIENNFENVEVRAERRMSSQEALQHMLKMDPQVRKNNNLFSEIKLRVPLIILAWMGGLFSGLGSTFMKCFTEALKTSGEFDNLQNPGTYLFFGIAACTMTLQIFTFNRALKYYDQLEVVPIYQSSMVVNGILAGSFILDEISLYTALNTCLISLGALVCISGILLLLKKPNVQAQAAKNSSKSSQISKSDSQVDTNMESVASPFIPSEEPLCTQIEITHSIN